MTGEPLIDIRDLTFSYPDGTRALSGLTVSIHAGQRVGLVGPNGAGKSTLLLHLGGMLSGTGSIRVAGSPMDRSHLRAIRAAVGLVFQNPDDQLFCPTVAEDLAFGPRNMKLDEHEVRHRVTAALAAVGLADRGGKSPFHLSFGERKRAAIATVLTMRPQAIVLDEPTSNLDPRGRREIIALLERLGGTQVVATHDLELVRQLCGRVLVLSGGRLVADGPPGEVLADESFLLAHGLA
ncbi:MAG: Energy-coupling factor transporter ATP-binding protein EcfA3 [Phycisphaerae bacterium]|nr:Energy-coupling factor transporter ATP-binding protein EcfA3 [Phycisphaerae bacterium]